MRRVIMLLLDGGGDRPSGGGPTPLYAAHKPNLDRLAAAGSCGILDPIAPGIRPGSDTAHLSIFGYDPYRYYTGRGAFEALGAGIELRPGDVAFRTNLATVDENNVVVDRRAGRHVSPEEASEVERLVNEVIAPTVMGKLGVEVVYKSTVEHRGVLVMRGPVSHRVSNTDPHKVGEPILEARPLDGSREGNITAEALNMVTRLFSERARELGINAARREKGLPPINAILARGGGYMPSIEPITRRYGVRAAAIAGVALIRGVARAVGMDVYTAPGLNGTASDEYAHALRLATDLLAGYDLIFLHVKGTDSAGHDGNYDLKRTVVERLDRALSEYMDRLEGMYVMVTSDHATPVSVREHTGDPVPILVYGPDVVRDEVDRFSELTCWRGALMRIRGMDIMPIASSYLGLSEKFGE